MRCALCWWVCVWLEYFYICPSSDLIAPSAHAQPFWTPALTMIPKALFLALSFLVLSLIILALLLFCLIHYMVELLSTLNYSLLRYPCFSIIILVMEFSMLCSNNNNDGSSNNNNNNNNSGSSSGRGRGTVSPVFLAAPICNGVFIIDPIGRR